MPKTDNQRSIINNHSHGQFGYIALFSTIILTAIFLLLFIGMFGLSVGGMKIISDKEGSQKASVFANICVEKVLAEIRKDTDYAGNETIGESGEKCIIGEVTVVGNTHSFNVDGEYLDYTIKISVKVDVTEEGRERTLKITEWKQI